MVEQAYLQAQRANLDTKKVILSDNDHSRMSKRKRHRLADKTSISSLSQKLQPKANHKSNTTDSQKSSESDKTELSKSQRGLGRKRSLK